MQGKTKAEWPKKKKTMKSSPKTTGGKRAKQNSSGASSWAKATKVASDMGFDLNKAVAKRKTLAKGSQEYNILQNQINRAMGSSTRHDVLSAKRDKDVKMANAKKGLKEKLPKTTQFFAGLHQQLGIGKGKKKKKGTNIAGGM